MALQEDEEIGRADGKPHCQGEGGAKDFLRKLSDPFWFQAFGSVLGFDWHSSGLTTTVIGALAESDIEGVSILGGKGRRARISPLLEEIGHEELAETSRLVAKMDTSVLQDGFSLYMHSMAFDERGRWVVVQQGMSGKWARRYHWYWEDEFFNTRSGIASPIQKERVLNLSSKESKNARKAMLDILNDGIRKSDILMMSKETNLLNFGRKDLRMGLDIDWRAMDRIVEREFSSFKSLVLGKGIGPKTIRALALVARLVYGTEPDWRDPVTYTYAHGGKDGVPYPVDRKQYEKTISYLADVVEGLDIEKRERLEMLSRLSSFEKHLTSAGN